MRIKFKISRNGVVAAGGGDTCCYRRNYACVAAIEEYEMRLRLPKKCKRIQKTHNFEATRVLA